MTRRERNLVRLFDAIGSTVCAVVFTADRAARVPGRAARRVVALLDPDLVVARISRDISDDTA